MPILLDASPLPTSETTLSGALTAARAAAEARRRVISEILLDGRPVTDAAWTGEGGGGVAAAPIGPDAELRFVTADPVELVQASLRDAAAALDRVCSHQSAAATAIQSGRFEAALPDLSEAFTIWESARRVLNDGCGLLGLRTDTLVVTIDGSPVPIAGLIRVLISRLSELKRALTARDWCGISDVLAYDLPADADLWRAMLRSLADSLPGIR